MTDTSNADNSPDAPPINQPSIRDPSQPSPDQVVSDWSRRARETTAPGGPVPYGVWQRGRDQPTTVAGGAPQPQPRQPQHPPNMGPGGDPRYNLFPPGTPLRPPPAFQPYAMPFPNRQTSDWGQTPLYPNLPQQFELPSLYQHLGGYFAQNGMGQGGLVGGLLMQIFSNAHQKAAMKGQLEQMTLMKDQLELNNAQLEENEQRGLTEYADILNEYEAAANQTDPDKLGEYAIGGMDVRHALELKAGELQNKPLMDLLNTGAPMSKIVQYLKVHDANWQALHAANKKASQANAEDAAWGQDPSAAAAPGTDGATGEETTGTGATAAASPIQSAIQYGLPPPANPAAPAPGAAPPGAGEQPDVTGFKPSDPMHDLVIRGFQGTADTTAMGPITKVAWQKGVARLDKAVDDIANDRNLSPDQVMDKVKAISPDIASNLDNILHYRRPIAGSSGAGGQGSPKMQAYDDLMGRLAAKINPNWSQTNYGLAMDFERDAQKPNSPIQRIPRAAASADRVFADLDAIQRKYPGASATTSPEGLDALVGKDPLWSRFKRDWLTYNEDIDVLSKGSSAVTTIEAGVQTIPQFPGLGSIGAYRAQAIGDMDNALGGLDTIHTTWDSYGSGRQFHGYNPAAETKLKAISRADYQTGARPNDVVAHSDGTHWKYLGKDPNDPGNVDKNWRRTDDPVTIGGDQ